VGVNMVFYCNEEGTTDQIREIQSNVNYTMLYNRLVHGHGTMPRKFVANTKGENQLVEPLYYYHDPTGVPDCGVYFVRRGVGPHQVHQSLRLSTINLKPGGIQFLIVLVQKHILPHARRENLQLPVDVHWLACRFRSEPMVLG